MVGKTILLLGANGQVGYESQRTLASLGRVVALDFPDIDFCNPESLRDIVRSHCPAIIVNTAAYTAVDKAESDAERAHAINADAPGVLAEEAEALGAILVHYSTDYVFDGEKDLPYVETDMPNPISVYGRTKLDGERAVARCKKHLIFRTSWVVGAHGANFIKTMLRLAGEREALRVVADQFGAPTSASLLAEVTAEALRQVAGQIADDTRWGLYHLVAAGETSWYGLARHVVARARAAGLALNAVQETIVPITTAEYPAPAARPANSLLNTTKIRNAFKLKLPDWSVGVNEALDQLIRNMRP